MRDERPFHVRMHTAHSLLEMADAMTEDLCLRAGRLDRLAEGRKPTPGELPCWVDALDRDEGITPGQLRRSITEIRLLLLRAEHTMDGR